MKIVFESILVTVKKKMVKYILEHKMSFHHHDSTLKAKIYMTFKNKAMSIIQEMLGKLAKFIFPARKK